MIPYLEYYKFPIGIKDSYEVFKEKTIRAIPTPEEYVSISLNFHGKQPFFEYKAFVQKTCDEIDANYQKYLDINFSINTRAISSIDDYNNFITECIGNGWEVFSQTEKKFIVPTTDLLK